MKNETKVQKPEKVEIKKSLTKAAEKATSVKEVNKTTVIKKPSIAISSKPVKKTEKLALSPKNGIPKK